jgi:hypothetical protein
MDGTVPVIIARGATGQAFEVVHCMVWYVVPSSCFPWGALFCFVLFCVALR